MDKEEAVRRRTRPTERVAQKPENGTVEAPRPPLVDFEDLPKWSQEAPHIRRYYRQISHSTANCLHSLLYLHNETVNIYSHLVPAVCALGAELVLDRLFVARYPLATAADRLVFAFHLLTMIICFGLSAGYHTFLCHSEDVAAIWTRVDYCGIMALMFGSFFSGIYVSMYCESTLQIVYWTMIGLFTALTAIVVLHPALQSPTHRTLRLCTFTATGASAIGPLAHIIATVPADRVAHQSGLYYYLAECFVFLAAALLYGSQWPESKQPGRFDLFGASHQLFHGLVVVGALVHVVGLVTTYEHNYYLRRC